MSNNTTLTQVMETPEFGLVVSIIGIIVTIVIFIYQEKGKNKEKDREAMRLTDEIVNLIIRNSVNNGISLQKVNLSYFLEGYRRLTNSEILDDKSQLSKMVYASVYQNEHISNDVRNKILPEVSDIIEKSELEIDNKGKSFTIQSGGKLLFHLMLTGFFVYVLSVTLPSKLEGLASSKSLSQGLKTSIVLALLVVILIIIPVMINVVVKPLKRELSTLLLMMDDFVRRRRASKRVVKTDEFHHKGTNVNISGSATVKVKPTVITPEKPEGKMGDFDKVYPVALDVFKHRYVMEDCVRTLYREIYKENTHKITFFKLLNRLTSDGYLAEDIARTAKELYSWCGLIIHEGADNDPFIQEKLSSLKNAIDLIKGIKPK